MIEDLHALPEAPIIVRCSWCPPEPIPPGVRVSHSICERHAAEMRAYMKTTMERELQTAGEPAESKTEI